MLKAVDPKAQDFDDEYQPSMAKAVSNQVGVIDPYERKHYPKLFAKLGSRIKEIEVLRRRAAEIAIQSGNCDRISNTDVNTTTSTLTALEFYVDCASMQHIELTELQIKQNAPALVNQGKAWTHADATRKCREMILARTLIPGATDIHSFLGTEVSEVAVGVRVPTVSVKMNFGANNVYGTRLPYRAERYFAAGGDGNINVAQRR